METSPELKEAARRLGLAIGKAAALQVLTREDQRLRRTVHSLYRNLSTAIALVPETLHPAFWEGIGQGVVQSRVEVGDVLPLLTGLPQGPQYEVVMRWTLEEIKEGKILRTHRGGFKAMNEPAFWINKGVISEFKRIAEIRRQREEEEGNNLES